MSRSVTRRAVLASAGATAGVTLVGGVLQRSDAATGTTPIVGTRDGRVRGKTIGAVSAFKGIPYAAASGNGRFAPPGPVEPWTGVRDALECGAPCPQVNRDFPAWVDPKTPSEDCLYLNVWTPASTVLRSPLPVMVWLHGGGFSTGSGGLPIYDGSNLAAHGNVVVVTVNHRLNVFGYLHVGLLGEPFADAINLGQRDLIAALQWVRENIQAFGGDRGNVTIFGESGGGAKVGTLCAMPQARGLFHKAIVESGSSLDVNIPEHAEEVAEAVLKELSIPRAKLERLASVPTAHLEAAGDAVERRFRGLFAFQPVVAAPSLPQQPWDPQAPAQSDDVPMLIGTNADETAAFLPDMWHAPADDAELTRRLVDSTFGERLDSGQAARLIETYRAMDSGLDRLALLVQISTDRWMWRNAIVQSERKAARGRARVFMCEFAWKTPCFGRAWALHGIEIPFVFDNLYYGSAWDGKDSTASRAAADRNGRRFAIARSTVAAWSAFAHRGDPTNRSMPAWPAYEVTRRATMVIDATAHVVDDPRAAARRLMS